MRQTAVQWWNLLQPEEQQELCEKYYPNNDFGALSMDEDDIKKLHLKITCTRTNKTY